MIQAKDKDFAQLKAWIVVTIEYIIQSNFVHIIYMSVLTVMLLSPSIWKGSEWTMKTVDSRLNYIWIP